MFILLIGLYVYIINWEDVCKPLENGGLGIKDVRIFNNALLVKWK